MGLTKKILLVEDSPEVQAMVTKLFRGTFTLLVSGSIREAREILEKQNIDLVLLDISLPDGDGLSYLATLKLNEKYKNLPVIFLTGRTATHEKIHGYQLGAEDYITKPFDPDLLKVIVNSKIQRTAQNRSESQKILIGNLELLLGEQRAMLHTENQDIVLDLPPIEFKLLLCFARHPGHLLSRQQLIQQAWGDGVFITDRTVDSHVSHLRKKLIACDHEIATTYGTGYTFCPRKVLSGKSAA